MAADAALNLPTPQLGHALAPAIALKVPGLQFVHAVAAGCRAELCPRRSSGRRWPRSIALKVPGLQFVHVVAAAAALNVPTPQFGQVLAPVDALKVPGLQFVHVRGRGCRAERARRRSPCTCWRRSTR